MQLTQPQQQKPSIGLFLLYIFAAIALIIFITYPKFSDWRTISSHITSDQKSLDKVTAEATQVKSEIANAQQADLTKVVSAVPLTPSLTELYAQVESLANASTVHLVSVQGIIDSEVKAAGAPAAELVQGASSSSTPTPVAKKTIKAFTVPTSLGSVSLVVDVNGSYSAVQTFLNSLYTSLRIINVQQVVMSVGKSNGGVSAVSTQNPSSTVDLKTQLQTYYSK